MKRTPANTEWSTEERLHELKGKLNLKERDNEAYYRYSQETIANNEKLINELRQTVRQQREVMASCLDGDRQVIQTALASQPFDVLTYNRATASKCIVEKNQDVFDQVKKLNNIQYQIRSHQNTINELELTLRHAKTNKKDRRNKTVGHDISDQRVRVLSTRLDKVLLKINSARYVNTTYKRLLSYLEKDSLSLPSRLDDLESCLEQQKQELSVLRKIHGESKSACEDTKHARHALEDTIIGDKQVRDAKLAKVRKNVKQLNEEAESYNVMNLQKMGGGRGASRPGKSEAQQRESNFFTPHKVRQKAALAAALGKLKETCGASTIEDISDNFERQLKRQQQLLGEAENFQKVREQLQAKLNQAEASLKRSKFEASISLDAAHAPEEGLVQTDDVLIGQMQQLGERRVSVNENVLKIQQALALFYSKCRDINTKLPSNEANNDKIRDAIESTFKPIVNGLGEQLIQDSDTTDREEAALIDYLPVNNVRISLPEEADETDGVNAAGQSTEKPTNKAMFDDDDDELVESNYFSREDIKKKSNEIMKVHNTKKKH